MTTPTDYQRIERVIDAILAHHPQQYSLAELASIAGLSEFHFQRLFTRWAGTSPKRFSQFLTKEHAKKCLREDSSLLDTALETGMSGPGRLHDLFVSHDGVTPGEYKTRGKGVAIEWGVTASPFGDCFIATTTKGVCRLHFLQDDMELQLQSLQKDWSDSVLTENPSKIAALGQAIFSEGKYTPLHIRGTNFQLKVWEALLKTHQGELLSYQQLAKSIGNEKASRAVGNAVAKNNIGYLIPCHRVIQQSGVIGNYRWGSNRKRGLIAWEASHSITETSAT